MHRLLWKVYNRLISMASPKYRMGYPTWTPWTEVRERVCIHPSVIISPSAHVGFWGKEPVPGHIGLEIGEDSHIFSSFNLLRPEATISIGKRCQLGNVLFACAEEIAVGDDVLMSWGINILDSNHHSITWEGRMNDVAICREDTLKGLPLGSSVDWSRVVKKKITIEDKCWIGAGVFILKGVTIHEGAVVGAGSIVTKDIEPWDIVAGNPAKSIR